VSLSPDGRQIAYVTREKPDNERKVCVRLIVMDEPKICFNISPSDFLLWTMDGKGLLYRNTESIPDSSSTVWLQSVTGGEPEPFLSVKPDSVFNISQSGDGTRTAVVRGNFLTDAVILTKVSLD
jgi:dipeptidyl aminopeptidase/acylaminoacyl peptidase